MPNIYSMTDLWNSVGTVFNAIKMNVTNTASAVGSRLMDLQVAGVSQFAVDPSGAATLGTPTGGMVGAGKINAKGFFKDGIEITGGGGGAPVDAEYITSSVNGTLTAERVLTNTATVTWDFSTPGVARANAAGGGGGTSVTIADTPPASPTHGNLWWESDTGQLFIYYDDVGAGGTPSAQWVAMAGGAALNAVKISGAPTANQIATWADGASIQGVSPEAVGATRVLLATVTPVGVPNAIFSITPYASAGYEFLEFVFNVTAVVGGVLGAFCARVSTDGGITFWQGSSDYSFGYNFTDSAGGTTSSGANAGFLQLGHNLSVVTTAHVSSGICRWFRPWANGTHHPVTSEWSGHNGSNYIHMRTSGSLVGSVAPMTHIVFFNTAGTNFSTGSSIKMYGVR